MDFDSYKKKFRSLSSLTKKTPIDKLGKLVHMDQKKPTEEDLSSKVATFEEKKDYSIYADSSVPWFRRWYMFAFVYPLVITIILGVTNIR